MIITDKERADFAKNVQTAMANWDLHHPNLEKSFEQGFISQGIEPGKAARMAKIAKDGPESGRGY